eukprot:416550-Rhodomonas_salina.1
MLQNRHHRAQVQALTTTSHARQVQSNKANTDVASNQRSDTREQRRCHLVRPALRFPPDNRQLAPLKASQVDQNSILICPADVAPHFQDNFPNVRQKVLVQPLTNSQTNYKTILRPQLAKQADERCRQKRVAQHGAVSSLPADDDA